MEKAFLNYYQQKLERVTLKKQLDWESTFKCKTVKSRHLKEEADYQSIAGF